MINRGKVQRIKERKRGSLREAAAGPSTRRLSDRKDKLSSYAFIFFFPVRQLCKKKVCVKSSTQETESFNRKTCTALFFSFSFFFCFFLFVLLKFISGNSLSDGSDGTVSFNTAILVACITRSGLRRSIRPIITSLALRLVVGRRRCRAARIGRRCRRRSIAISGSRFVMLARRHRIAI